MLGNIRWDAFFPKPDNLFFVQAAQWGIFALSLLAYFLAAQQTIGSLKITTFTFITLGVAALIIRCMAATRG